MKQKILIAALLALAVVASAQIVSVTQTPYEPDGSFSVSVFLPSQLEKPANALAVPACFSLPAGRYTKIRSLAAATDDAGDYRSFLHVYLRRYFAGAVTIQGVSLHQRFDLIKPHSTGDVWKIEDVDFVGPTDVCALTAAIPATAPIAWQLTFIGKAW